VEDFKGKIWATTGATDAKALQLLGGAPTSLSSSELYLSFERGVIDGTPRPLLTGMGRSLYEVVDHITLTNFAIDTSILAINTKTWQSLPPHIQSILQEGAEIRDELQFQMVTEFVKQAVEKYKSLGVNVTVLDANAKEKLIESTRPVIDEWVNSVSDGDQYIELIEASR
jgi:TRAP-type C4-dicarboxylate transport system substrate-binding protein